MARAKRQQKKAIEIGVVGLDETMAMRVELAQQLGNVVSVRLEGFDAVLEAKPAPRERVRKVAGDSDNASA